MAHPDDGALRHSLQQGRIRGVHLDLRPSVLPESGPGHIAPQDPLHQLCAVAESQNRDPEGEQLRGAGGGAFFIAARRTSGQDDALRRHLPDLLQRGTIGIDLAVDVVLPDPARHQLVVLSAEINDDDFFLVLNFHSLFSFTGISSDTARSRSAG